MPQGDGRITAAVRQDLRRGIGRRSGLRPKMINIWRDSDAAAFVRSVADGNETVPTVVIDGSPIVNPSTRIVVAALRRADP